MLSILELTELRSTGNTKSIGSVYFTTLLKSDKK